MLSGIERNGVRIGAESCPASPGTVSEIEWNLHHLQLEFDNPVAAQMVAAANQDQVLDLGA